MKRHGRSVVRRADSERVEEDIRLDANKRLSPIQAIAGVTFMDELPRSDIGKILKRQLRDTFSSTLRSSVYCSDIM